MEGLFKKELYEEIKTRTKEINKLESYQDRVNATVELRLSIYSRINDEIDELLTGIHLKKSKYE